MTRWTTQAAHSFDRRFPLAGTLREESSHVFPKHHSFLWGELALYSFAVLVISGTYLTLFFVPDTTEVVYTGPYDNIRGLHTSRAYESALTISFEVTGGLFIRQMHHWASLVFVASIVLHLFRNFLTGAFRRPRGATWLTGVAALLITMPEGYLGYSMLDDLLSGVGVRIMSGLLLSLPVVGTWLHWIMFGGEFDGELWISRFFIGHVFLLPGLLAVLVAVHLALVWYLKHTCFPGPGVSESTVVGERAVPGFAGRTLANGLCVVGVLALMAAWLQINPVFLWGPYTPADSSTGVQPDWYIGFIIGGLRLMPPWDLDVGEYTVPAAFWPGIVLPLVVFVLLFVYPVLERLVTRDRAPHHVLQRPRDNAVRTGIGMMALTAYAVLMVVGGDDVLSIGFDIPFEWFVFGGRVALFVLPPLAFLIAYRICRALQRADRDVLRRGVRTGVLRETADGVYAEVRQPPGGVDHQGRPVPLDYGGARVGRGIAADDEPTG